MAAKTRLRQLTAGLAALALGSTLLAGQGPAVAADSHTPPDAPAGLTVNDRERHLNVEDAPRFAWLSQDRDGNEIQTAYQVRVLDDADELVWDSGKVASGEQSQVAYGGPALEPASTYTWTVRTWDRIDLASPWAEPGMFDTGIGNDDWEASWIRRPPDPSSGPLSIVDGRLRVTGGGVTLSRDGAAGMTRSSR